MELKSFIWDVTGATDALNKKQALIDGQVNTINGLNQKVIDLSYLLDSTGKQDKQAILDLEAQLESIEKLYAKDPMEEYWNNRYPKTYIGYTKWENKLEYSMDVRNFFQPNDSNIPIIAGVNFDEKAFSALQYVRKNIVYVPDKTVYGYDEYWAWAFETLVRKKGDCEDGAILMANIMLRSGIPYWRIRLNAGTVNGGGHAYVTYCRETDNQFVVLDWCYWFSNTPIKDRPLHSSEMNYDDEGKGYGIWFSWNRDFIFGKMQTMVKKKK